MLNEYDFSKAEKINMNTTDKVQVGDSTTGTSTSTTTSQWQTYNHYNAERGWECPRCGHINAPWVRQCDCSSSNWTITCDDLVYRPREGEEWWKKYVTTCKSTSTPQTQIDTDTFRIHPESTPIYQVGGSDYKEGHTYVNVGGTQSNKIDPNVTAWSCTQPDIAVNDFTTYRTDVPKTYTTIANSTDNLQKQLDKLKETK